jgi:basic amino acid/polyamine antiporter, APA family
MKPTLGLTGSTMNAMALIAPGAFLWLTFAGQAAYPPDSIAYQFNPQTSAAFSCEFATTNRRVNGQTAETIVRKTGGFPQCAVDASGKPVPYHVAYPGHDASGGFLSHPSGASVFRMHNFGWMFVQAAVAILILVGFESVTSMGAEAKNAKPDVPAAVVTSSPVQGAFCYLFEYFAANYFLNSGYTMQNAAGSAVPVGDMMIMLGDAILRLGRGRIFMLCEAATVFLALIGTTLSCRASILAHESPTQWVKTRKRRRASGFSTRRTLRRTRAMWTLAIISAIVGCLTVAVYFGDGAAPTLRFRPCRMVSCPVSGTPVTRGRQPFPIPF